MDNLYTEERSFQILISLLKARSIDTIIASPGTTNVAFVASVQGDSFFKVYSAPDERSAAYMACGYAAKSGKPVVLTCTGATASRNYLPGLTEAYYRRLPIIALTSARHPSYVGQLTPQAIDRTVVPADVAVASVQIPAVYSDDDERGCILSLNEVLIALTEHGGGPVHINIVAEINNGFSARPLPPAHVIDHFGYESAVPDINAQKIAIFIGNHEPFPKELEDLIDRFCELYNACVLCDHTSNFHGRYRVQYNLVSGQVDFTTSLSSPDLLIDLGDVSGSYMALSPSRVWRVSESGALQDRFRSLSAVFEMSEFSFFRRYVEASNGQSNVDRDSPKMGDGTNDVGSLYFRQCTELYDSVAENIPEVPFSNIWIASRVSAVLPANCNVHFGILNSLRSWSFFEIDPSITCFSNTGGFGIDGVLSTLIGCSLVDERILNFCFIGDLAFFYDMNALGNRHVCGNIRILLVNNGVGTEFKNYSHIAHRFGNDADDFIAAAGHYGNKSENLVRHYAKDLGFDYMSASTKDEFMHHLPTFVNTEDFGRPIVFEVFTTDSNESDALEMINHILVDPLNIKARTKQLLKDVVGEDGVKRIKKMVAR